MTATRERLARRVADAARAVPGVARLSTADTVLIATPFAGGRVDGVRVEEDRVTVGVVIDTVPVQPILDELRHAVTSAVQGTSHAVRIVVADIDVDRLPGAAG